MSMVIVAPNKEYHKCEPPYVFKYGSLDATYPEKSFWKCSCGKWYKVVLYVGYRFPVYHYYRRVRWYYFDEKMKIRNNNGN